MKTTTFPRRTLAALTALVAATAACDDGDDPMTVPVPMVAVSATSADFGALDLNFGAGPAQSVTVTNSGAQTVLVGSPSLAGDADDFVIVAGNGGASLAAGATLEIGVAFDPRTAGARTATLEIPTNDAAAGALSVTLAGTGQRFSYVQVDRMGIPALNTVFNHPPAFSKTDYNTASPAGDRAAYTGLFETVLGAVANPDPAATAALLLPDELPVSMGTATTSFATLTGRAPADDATDVALSVVVGIESLHSDNVDANDRAFLSSFPYLAEPHR